MGNINIKLKAVIYVLITFAFLYIWIKLIDFKIFFEILVKANYYIIILAAILNIFHSYLSSLRVQLLFKSQGSKINIFDIWTGGWISSLITSFLPFYSGGFVYSYLLSKKGKLSYKKTFFILLCDFVIGIFNILSFLAMPFLKLREPKYFSRAILLSLLTFSFGVFTHYIYFYSFGLILPLMGFFIAHCVLIIVSLIPGPPLKIGQYELTGMLVFTYFLTLDKNLVSAVFVMQHIISLLLVSILGLISAYLIKYDFKK